MKSLKLALAAAALFSANASALDASSLKLQVYSVMLSTSPQCTSPITVFSSATPTEVDFLATPTLGSGNPPDGTYHCVIIKMSDLIKFTPSTTGGSCAAGTEYVADVPLATVVAAVARRAEVANAELVGLAPRAALEGFPAEVPMPGFDPARHIIENALGS